MYYLTTAARCSRLAAALAQTVVFHATKPPLPPPDTPLLDPPSPPPPPPSPSLPVGIAVAPGVARLSTVRAPIVANTSSDVLFADGYHIRQSDFDSALAAMKANPSLVACGPGPLPCVSASDAAFCVPGRSSCRSELLRTPSVAVILQSPPRKRAARLFGVRFVLPQTEELAGLLFASAEQSGGRGYEVKLFDTNGASVPCDGLDKQVHAGVPAGKDVVHVCATRPDSVDGGLLDVTRVEVVLTGTLRQVWLRDVQVLEIAHGGEAPPAPPPLPGLPPAPPASPAAACSFTKNGVLEGATDVGDAPCGFTLEQCCLHARETPTATAFSLSDSGCCAPLIAGAGSVISVDTEKLGFVGPDSGVGFV